MILRRHPARARALLTAGGLALALAVAWPFFLPAVLGVDGSRVAGGAWLLLCVGCALSGVARLGGRRRS